MYNLITVGNFGLFESTILLHKHEIAKTIDFIRCFKLTLLSSLLQVTTEQSDSQIDFFHFFF